MINLTRLQYYFCSASSKYFNKINELQIEKTNLMKQSALSLLASSNYKDASYIKSKYDQEIKQIEEQQSLLSKWLKEKEKEELQEQLKEININDLISNQQLSNIIKEDMEYQQQQEEPQQVKKDNSFNIPDKLQIRNLQSPLNENGNIIVFGIQRENHSHAQYIYDALSSLKPQLIITQLSPDLPFFIKTEDDYQLSWRKFLEDTSSEYQFLVNPNPKQLTDILLNESKINWLMRNNIQKNPNMQLAPIFIREYFNIKGVELSVIDVLKTPLIYAYNHKIPTIIGGYPEINYRNYLANNASEQQLLDIFKSKQQAIKEKSHNFDPLLLNSDLFIKPRIKYECEIMKLSLTFSNKIVAVVDANSTDFIEQYWKESNHNTINNNINEIIQQEYQSKNKFYGFMKNLILIDLLTNKYITDNFIKYQSFPFTIQSSMKFSLVDLWKKTLQDYLEGRQVRNLDI